MKILFALASIVIVYPLILVLPLGLKAKQKLVLLMVSLLISLLAVLSINIIPLWQTIMLLIALPGLASILVSKRMSQDKEEFKPSNQVGYYDQKQLIMTPLHEDNSNEAIVLQPVENDIENVNIKPDELISEVELDEIDSKDFSADEIFEPLYDEINVDLYVAASIELDEKQELFEELLDIDVIYNNELEVMKQNDNIVDDLGAQQLVKTESTQYLSEIEKLLYEEENESLVEKKENVTTVSKKEKTVELKDIKLEELF